MRTYLGSAKQELRLFAYVHHYLGKKVEVQWMVAHWTCRRWPDTGSVSDILNDHGIPSLEIPRNLFIVNLELQVLDPCPQLESYHVITQSLRHTEIVLTPDK